MRRRGLEAPVQLRQLADEQPSAEVEKGDGEPRHPSPEKERPAPKKSSDDDAAPQQRGIRVWPMRANTYTFTQPFGCVQQIANFYFPGEGCPADAPVIHSGVDLGAPEGTPFYASAAGWVTDSGYDREVGVPNTRIIIQHVDRNERYSTVYLHWIASYVEIGDFVEAGEMIGEVGNVGYSTGPHLHFEVVDLDSGENIDPIPWLPKEPGNEGYRGIQPHSRASMRLPAGTTAGLPETADPAPPPPPERQHVPDSPPDRQRDGKSDRKHKQERSAIRDSTSSDKSNLAAEDSTSDDATAESESASKAKGKHKDRTRERNKDGGSKKDAADGDNGNEGSTSDDSPDDSQKKSTDRSKHDNRGGRHGKSGGHSNGRDNNHHGQRDGGKHNKNGGDNGRKNDNGSGGSDGSAGGGGTGESASDDISADDSGSDDSDEPSDDVNVADSGENPNESDGETPEKNQAVAEAAETGESSAQVADDADTVPQAEKSSRHKKSKE